MLDGPVVPLEPQSQAALASTPITPDQTALFACDDSALMAQYMAAYPPLQPTRVDMQPPANREMVYPGAPGIVKYDENSETNRAVAGLGIQSQSQLMPAAVVPTAMPAPYPTEPDSPPFGGDNGFMRVQRFSSVQGFDVKEKAPSLDMQGQSTTFDLFPHQRTIPARRGPFKDHGMREKTARTRKMGSCIRCRMQRIRVSSTCTRHGAGLCVGALK